MKHKMEYLDSFHFYSTKFKSNPIFSLLGRCGEWRTIMEHKMEYLESSHFYSTKFKSNPMVFYLRQMW
jgi:hypothetical protein